MKKILTFFKKIFAFFFYKKNSKIEKAEVPILPVTEEGNALVDELLNTEDKSRTPIPPSVLFGVDPAKKLKTETAEEMFSKIKRVNAEKAVEAMKNDSFEVRVARLKEIGVLDSNNKLALKPKVELELWIDDPKRKQLSEDYWDTIQGLGFTTAAIMIETAVPGWDLRFNKRDMARIGKLAEDRGISLVLTVWPDPNKKYLNNFRRGIVPLLSESGAMALEADLEFNWKKNIVQDFANYDKAGDYLVDIFDSVQAKTDVEIEVTTFPYHIENSKNADVSPYVDRLMVQAYSVRHRDKLKVSWNHALGPNKIVDNTLRRTRQINSVKDVEIGVGLAAYDQIWPNRHPHEAMYKAWRSADAFKTFPIVKRRYWSSKHILGIRKKEYAFTFFRDKIYEKKA